MSRGPRRLRYLRIPCPTGGLVLCRMRFGASWLRWMWCWRTTVGSLITWGVCRRCVLVCGPHRVWPVGWAQVVHATSPTELRTSSCGLCIARIGRGLPAAFCVGYGVACRRRLRAECSRLLVRVCCCGGLCGGPWPACRQGGMPKVVGGAQRVSVWGRKVPEGNGGAEALKSHRDMCEG